MVLWGGLDVVFGSALLAGLGNVSFEPVCSGVLSVGVWCRVWLAIVVCSVGLAWCLLLFCGGFRFSLKRFCKNGGIGGICEPVSVAGSCWQWRRGGVLLLPASLPQKPPV